MTKKKSSAERPRSQSFLRHAAKLSTALFVLATTACGTEPAETKAPVEATQQPIWVNGDFEDNAVIGSSPTGWTVTTNLNSAGVLGTPPTTIAQLQLANGGANQTVIVGGAAETVQDPNVGANGTLRFPKYGTRAVRVNNGNGQNTNTMTQTMTVSVGDVDPTDDKVHVRFAVAPVLENPGHPYNQQPYYFVLLQNLTKNTTLYSDFNISGQAGVPWKQVTGNAGLLYTDWQLVDIAPGNAGLAIGDSVKLTVVAAGCQPNGHFGRIYVDAVGSGIPGLYSWASGPQAANRNDVVTYTVSYKNGGTTATSGSFVQFTTPPETTFVSAPANCTGVNAGATGTTRCELGLLPPGATGSFQISVRINLLAAGPQITNGNYGVGATGVSVLIGPKVITNVTTAVVYTDLSITKTDGVAALVRGQNTTYTIVARNNAPLVSATTTVTDTMPAGLTNVTWTCAGANGAVCGAASGTGNIADTGFMAPISTRTYLVTGTVANDSPASLVNEAKIAVSGIFEVDPDLNNNSAVDTNSVGTLRQIAVTKVGPPAAGTIASTPASISCGAACTTASGDFLEGSQVVLTATPAAGSSFAGWTGGCAAAGASPTCTLTVGAANVAVSARFVGAPSVVAVGSGSPQSAVVNAAFGADLVAIVQDAAGQPVPGVTVTFAAPGAGASASLSVLTAVTDANGRAVVRGTANTVAGAYTVTASAQGATAASFALTNTAGAPASITAAPSSTPQTARVNVAFAQPLAVTVVDQYGNPVSAAQITYTRPGAGASATGPTTATTNASGVASVAATANGIAGTYTVTASIGALSTTFTLRNQAGAPALIALVSGSLQTAGVDTDFAAPLVVEVRDATNNLVENAVVTFASPNAGATAALSGVAGTTGPDGRASVTAHATTVAGQYSVEATVAGGQGPVQFVLTNAPGAPARVVASPGSTPQSAAAATQFPAALAVSVEDRFGNPVPNTAVTFEVPAVGSTGTLSAPTATTGTDGTASVQITAGTLMGTFVATARVGEASATFSLNILAGPATQLGVVGGSPQRTTVLTDFPIELAVRVADANGNPVANASVDFAGPGDGASATFASPVVTSGVDGIATVRATANGKAGAYSVTASTREGAAPATFSLVNDAGAVASIAPLPGSTPQNITVTEPFAVPLGVLVLDAQQNPVPNVVVTWTAPAVPAGASLSALTAKTDENGEARVQATAGGSPATYQVTAQAAGSAETAVFALGNLAGAPSELRLVSGTGQSALATTAFADPIVVQVVDRVGNPLNDVLLTVAAPEVGPSATVLPAAPRTGATGTASLQLTANASTGAYSVTVSAPNGITPVTIDLTNQAIPTTTALALVGVATAETAATFHITVESELIAPAGVVKLFDGAQELGTATLVGGEADISVTFAAPGPRPLIARYGAQDPFAASESETLTVDVQSRPDPGDDDGGIGDGGGSSGGSSGSPDASSGGSSGTSGASGSNGGSSGTGNTSGNGGTSGTSGDDYFGLSGGSGCNAAASGGSLWVAFLTMFLVLRRGRRNA